MKRVGHKGADAIVPGNTLASFDAAVEAGVDMIEFDVVPADPRAKEISPLVLAHDPGHVAGAPTLEEGLVHLAGAAFHGIELDVDLKGTGYERRVVEALQAHGMVERTLISSQFRRSLAAVRKLEPGIRLGWSVPRARRDYTRSVFWAIPALATLAVIKRALPAQAAKALGAGHSEALMVFHRLVTPALVHAIQNAGGELYVWTVDDAAEIRRFEAMGVDAVISNDPRLFPTVAPTASSGAARR